jgi:hypothetical protein
MDHRWDDSLRQEHGRRAEQSRFAARAIERDPDVERRDQLAEARRRVHLSPWEIGEAHWDQRDLFTRNAQSNDEGYGEGPSYHPEEGSYAYRRDVVPRAEHRAPMRVGGDEPTLYEREAWPWLNYYDRVQPDDEERGVWRAMKHEAATLVGKLTGHPDERRGPKGWRRADDTIREDVCEALAYTERLDARDIEVEVKDAEVWLKGTVRDRFEKRLAEDLAEHVRGVVDVHNRLRLRKDDDDMSFTSPVPAF